MNATLTEKNPVKESRPFATETSSPKRARRVALLAGALLAAGALTAGIVPRIARDAKAAESQRRASLAPMVIVEPVAEKVPPFCENDEIVTELLEVSIDPV